MTQPNELDPGVAPRNRLETPSEPARNSLGIEKPNIILKCIICNFTPETKHSSLITPYYVQPKKFGGTTEQSNTIEICKGCRAIIEAMMETGDIDTKYVQSRFVYTKLETVNSVRNYLIRSKKRARLVKKVSTFGQKNRELIK